MKMRKKILAFFITLAMILTCIPTYSISAAKNVQITVDSVSAKPGEEFEIRVRVGAGASCSAFEFNLYYDKSKIEYVEHTIKGTGYKDFLDDHEGIFSTIHNEEEGNIKFVAAVLAEVKQETDVLIAKFRIKNDAKGSTQLEIRDVLLQNVNMEDIAFDVSNGIITIEGTQDDSENDTEDNSTKAETTTEKTESTSESTDKNKVSMKDKETLNTVLEDIKNKDDSDYTVNSLKEWNDAIDNAEKAKNDFNTNEDKFYDTLASLAIAKANLVVNKSKSDAIVKAPFYVAVDRVSLEEVTLKKGELSKFEISVPENYSISQISYQVVDSNVATVAEDGTIAAIQNGCTVVRVTIQVAGISRTIETMITVK